MGEKKQLILNAFVESCSGHQSPGLWAHPDDQSSNFNDVKHWVKLAKLLEEANFHGIFIADVLVSFFSSIENHKDLRLNLPRIMLHIPILTSRTQFNRGHTMSTRVPGILPQPLSRVRSGQ